jgi:hypothetical protein
VFRNSSVVTTPDLKTLKVVITEHRYWEEGIEEKNNNSYKAYLYFYSGECYEKQSSSMPHGWCRICGGYVSHVHGSSQVPNLASYSHNHVAVAQLDLALEFEARRMRLQ